MSRRPNRSLEEFVTFVREAGFTPATVIDVGACYGTPELLHGFPGAYHILFEPVAELEDRMKVIMKKFRGEYHMIALGDAPGVMPMNVPQGNLQGATLAVVPGSKAVREVRVDTLDTMFAGRTLDGPVLLKTDCQGYDLKVMQGGTGFLKQVDLVVMEVNMFHPAGNRSLPDFGEIVCWMRGQGFAVYDIVSYQTRPFDGALGYVDLVFARNDSRFRAHHRWQ
jgi:FkbM family methyltransferase